MADPDLGDAMATLRGRAEALAPDGFATKLLIPNSQILYTSVTASDDAAIRRAVDGLTPYSVDDLVYDWQADGDSTRVALLARETLDEAEGFANDHGMRPVGFAAIPPEGKFPREPWFGPTLTAPASLAEGEVAEGDAQPVIIVEAPEPEVPPAPPEAEPEPVIAAEPEPEPVPEPAVVWQAPAEPEPEPEAPEEPAPRPEPAPQPIFDHPSFQSQRPKPVEFAATREQRPAKSTRREPGMRTEPKLAERDAPFVDLSRPSEPPVANRTPDLTPPPLRAKATPPRPTPVVAPLREAAKPQEPVRTRTDPFGAGIPPKGSPKFLGLILTVLLLLVLAAIAAWSSYYIADLWGTEEEEVVVAQVEPAAAAELPPAAPEAAETVADQPPEATSQDEIALTTTDAPMPDAAAQVAALVPATPDIRPDTAAAPPPFGTDYAFDDEGRIEPTEQGVVTPDGVTLVEGAPPKVPPPRPAPAPGAEAAAEAPAPSVDPALADARPRMRPESAPAEAAPAQEAELGITSSPRPRERTESVVEAARPTDAASLVASDTGTALAVAISRRPEMRPSGISNSSVQAALTAAMAEPAAPRAAPQATVQRAAIRAPEPAPVPAARTEQEADDEPEAAVVPRIPTRASVAQQATMVSALDLGRMNVIGISGTSSNRAALIRQSNGRVSRVRVGDRVDGGTVAAITENAVHYQKGGRMLALEMPRG
ncbi:hypothetical protein [Falsirhodobacter xinxiangensis]|uniref:hypothetical protein n=1 Tax=Falsirhodobacter xinxiangensis TaxID=2530049 RepID=UPI0010AB1F24|nr:hypothetical protein [Rhodobacter xinxiangensis]